MPRVVPGCLAVALVLTARPASGHGVPPIELTAPAGVGDVVTRGTPYTVRWTDTDLYPDTWITVMLRSDPPPPYIHDWPSDDVEGVAVSERIALTDPTNEVTIETDELEAGDWFVWIAFEDETGLGKYVRPSGVLAVTDPGQPPAPVVWFEAPADTATSVDGTYTVVYSTAPAEGVTVTLEGSINDLEGEALEARAQGLPGGALQRHRIETIACEEPGSFGFRGRVVDERGLEGSAFAPGRVAWFGLDPGTSPPAVCRESSGEGCGCHASGSPGSPIAALFLAALALTVRRRARRKAPARRR